MSKIIIERPNGWLYPSTNNNIYIDGVKVGSLTDGESLEHAITQGKHTIVAKSRWGGDSKVIEVHLGPDECKTIKLTAVKFFFWIPVLMPFVIATITYLSSLIFDVNLEFAYLMIGFLGIYLVYYFTFGKDTFWKLRED